MQPDPVMTRASEPPDAVLRYAAHDDGLVDVHLPAGPNRPRPLVVYVHGGFWRTEYDRTHARPLANALVREGFVVASLEYRRGPGAWPQTSADLTAALTALPGLLAGLAVRTTTTTLVGHSAGGHLVLWLANEPHPHHRVVALAPVGNLRKAVEHGMGSGAAVDFLGGTPEQVPDVYDAADPAYRMRERPAARRRRRARRPGRGGPGREQPGAPGPVRVARLPRARRAWTTSTSSTRCRRRGRPWWTPSAGETLAGMSSSRRIAVVGAGPAGTALALGLVRDGYDVTLVSDRTAEEIRGGSVMSSQITFESALESESALGITPLLPAAPPIERMSYATIARRRLHRRVRDPAHDPRPLPGPAGACAVADGGDRAARRQDRAAPGDRRGPRGPGP